MRSQLAACRSWAARIKAPGAVVDGLAQGVEVAACLRRQKDEGLLRFGRNGDKHALVADLSVPGLNAGKPIRRRWIGGSAQECNHQNKTG